MNVIRQTLKSILTSTVSSRWLLTRAPRHPAGTRPRIALTFDDGPHPQHTHDLLDVLQEHGATATFFVIGQNAREYPQLIRRIVGDGHELGNHTWSHSEPSRTSSLVFFEEIERTDVLIRALTGVATQTVRPPKGELNFAKLRGLWQQGKNVALWNVDPCDYRMTSQAQAADWASNYEPHDGDVLLFHDNHPWASTAVSTLARRGVFERFETTCLSNLIGLQAPTPRQTLVAASSSL